MINSKTRKLTSLFFKISFTNDNADKSGNHLRSYCSLFLISIIILLGILKASSKFNDLYSETLYCVFVFNFLAMYLIYPDSTEIDVKHFYFTSLRPIPEMILFKANLLISLIIFFSILLLPAAGTAVNIFLKYKISFFHATSFFFICLLSGLAFVFIEFGIVTELSKKYSVAKMKIFHSIMVFTVITFIYFFSEIIELKNLIYLDLRKYAWIRMIPFVWSHSLLYIFKCNFQVIIPVILYFILLLLSIKFAVNSRCFVKFSSNIQRIENKPLGLKMINALRNIGIIKKYLLPQRRAAIISFFLLIKSRENFGTANQIEHYLYLTGYLFWVAISSPSISPFVIIAICSISALSASIWISESRDYKASYIFKIAPLKKSDIIFSAQLIIFVYKFLPQYILMSVILIFSGYDFLSLIIILPAIHFLYITFFVIHQRKKNPVSTAAVKNIMLFQNLIVVTCSLVYFTAFEMLYNFYGRKTLNFHLFFCFIFLFLIYIINRLSRITLKSE